MPSKVAVFHPSRWYAVFAALSLVCAVACGWFASIMLVPEAIASDVIPSSSSSLPTAAIAWAAVSGLFTLTLLLCVVMLLRPRIVVNAHYLQVGQRKIAWDNIASLETSHWNSPLLVRITLADGPRLTILYSGDGVSCHRLLHLIGRNVRHATLDGIPYREVWGYNDAQFSAGDYDADKNNFDVFGEAPISGDGTDTDLLMRPEDAEEVERLYQRLKKVGRLDQGPGEDA